MRARSAPLRYTRWALTALLSILSVGFVLSGRYYVQVRLSARCRVSLQHGIALVVSEQFDHAGEPVLSVSELPQGASFYWRVPVWSTGGVVNGRESLGMTELGLWVPLLALSIATGATWAAGRFRKCSTGACSRCG